MAWARSFASRPGAAAAPEIVLQLDVVSEVPPAPAGAPDFRQGALLAYYVAGSQVTAHFPRYGLLQLDLAQGRTQGWLVPAGLETYGVLEDLIAIGLSPHLRRRGLFLLHAFAAAHAGRAVLLVGGIGAGKTTTGMALLDAGWQLLSNDSPIITAEGVVLSYPGVLAAYPATFARFAATAALATGDPARKQTVAAEAVWPGVWRERATVAAICFPQIESRPGHLVTRLSRPETLRRLLPHAVEQWDRPVMPAHLAALGRLVESAPGYLLRLGPDVGAVAGVVGGLL